MHSPANLTTNEPRARDLYILFSVEYLIELGLAMAVLASAINRLGSVGVQLDSTSAAVITTFLTERAVDYASQQEVLDGVRGLLQYQRAVTPDLVTKLAKAYGQLSAQFFFFLGVIILLLLRRLFNSDQMHIQSMPQSSRKVAFEIFELLFAKFTTGTCPSII